MHLSAEDVSESLGDASSSVVELIFPLQNSGFETQLEWLTTRDVCSYVNEAYR